MDANEREYRIRKVADFLKVPKDRRAVCLTEFVDFLDTMEALAIYDEPEIGFVWRDDGKPGCSGVMIEVEVVADLAKEGQDYD